MLFIDTFCAKPYTGQTLGVRPMGGSEASLIRIAQAIPGARVMQHNRQTNASSGGVDYAPLNWNRLPAGPIVVSRDAGAACRAAETSPGSSVFLWLHDLVDQDLLLFLRSLHKFRVELIFVSAFQKQQYLDFARLMFGPSIPLPEARVIHNPISNDLEVRDRSFDADRLVFLSSPHKGLNETLDAFVELRRRYPKLELHIANPGYHPDPRIDLPGVTVLGALPQAQALDAARGALCLFYPNYSYPETFGIVFAEANAIGVPVLAHDFGAAREVLGAAQVLNCRNFEAVADRIEAWRSGERPVVHGRDDLRVSHIAGLWRELLAR